MARLSVQLLGTPRIVFNGEDRTEQLIGYRKAFALLIYLLVEKGAQSRASLAALLWPDINEQNSLAYLRGRSGLLRLNQVLPGVLQADVHEVTLNNSIPISLDCDQYQSLLAGRQNMANFRAAADLYHGAFCQGFLPPADVAEVYEDWFFVQREQLAQQQLLTLSRLVERYNQLSEFAESRKYAREMVRLDPHHEEGHHWLMQLYAWEGRRNLALTHYETYRQHLWERLGLEPGREMVRLSREIASGQLPPPRPAPFLAPNLPPHMVPRPDLRRRATGPLQQSRVLALVGMPGIGKSTLAAQLAHELRAEFPDGVLWADMAATPPAEILTMWGLFYDFELDSQPTLEARHTAWRGITQGKQILIILDGVVHSENARPLLPHSPGCVTLITTRSYDVAAALHARPLEMELFANADGVALLKNILPARTTQEPQAAAAICDLLEGLPLAIEILAQRLSTRAHYTLAAAYNRLHQIRSRLDILQLEDRAVRTSFELSWQTLERPLQALFAALSSFSGRPFHPTAVQAMTGEEQTGVQLEDLAALSLVQRLTGGYFRQHALLAEFATEKVPEIRLDIAFFERRLIPFYTVFGQQHAQDYPRLRQEWGNLQTALDLAHRHREWVSVFDLGRQLTTAWFVRARYSDARRAYRLCYDAALMLENDEGVARTLLDWGRACIEQGDYPEAWQHLDESLLVFSEHLADPIGAAEVQLERGRLAKEQSRWDDAHQWLAAAQAIFEQHGLLDMVAIAQYRQATVAYQQSNYDQAHSLCTYALQTITDDRRIPALNLLVDILLRWRELSAAEQYLQEAQALCEKNGDKANEAIIWSKYGRLLRWQEDFKQARDCQLRCLGMLRSMGDRKGEALALFDLSRIAHDEGEYEQAIFQARECLALFDELEAKFDVMNTTAHLGTIYRSQNDTKAAIQAWEQALRLAEELDNDRYQDVLQRWIQEI